MTRLIKTRPITREAFAPYGDLLDATGMPDKLINQGKCERFHDRALLDFSDGRAGVSIFSARKETLPMTLEMVERHPEGSQAFIPMFAEPFLVVVARDDDGTPVDPIAFLTAPGQAINFHRGTWHGVLSPLSEPAIFAVIDRIGPGKNLQEYWFTESYMVER